MLTLEEALKNWEEAGHHGTREQRIVRGKKWLPYYAYLAQRQKDAPFALPENVKVYLDESLKRFETVFPAVGTAASAIELTIPELERFSGFRDWVDVCKGWQAEDCSKS